MNDLVYVKLLKNVAEGGRDLAEAVKAADALGLPKGDQHYPRLKVVKRRGKETRYVKGAVVDMHREGAKKWHERGLCEPAPAPKA
jgi:hypothetical protein